LAEVLGTVMLVFVVFGAIDRRASGGFTAGNVHWGQLPATRRPRSPRHPRPYPPTPKESDREEVHQ
jgi:hypothetical protein